MEKNILNNSGYDDGCLFYPVLIYSSGNNKYLSHLQQGDLCFIFLSLKTGI